MHLQIDCLESFKTLEIKQILFYFFQTNMTEADTESSVCANTVDSTGIKVTAGQAE